MNPIEELLNNTLGCLYLVGVFSVVCVHFHSEVALRLTHIPNTDFTAAHAARSCIMSRTTFPAIGHTSQPLYVPSKFLGLGVLKVALVGCFPLVGHRLLARFDDTTDTESRVLDTAKTMVDLGVCI